MGPHEAWTGCDMRENKEIVSFDPRLRMPHSCELGLQCCWSTSSNLVVAAQSADVLCRTVGAGPGLSSSRKLAGPGEEEEEEEVEEEAEEEGGR